MVMNHSKCWVASLLAVSALTAAFSQQTGATNGAIIDQKPCVFGPYEQQSEFTRRYYSKEDYDYAKSSPRTECSRIEYRSDGLRVVGYLVRPRDIASRRFPVIIFNRGGFLGPLAANKVHKMVKFRSWRSCCNHLAFHEGINRSFKLTPRCRQFGACSHVFR